MGSTTSSPPTAGRHGTGLAPKTVREVHRIVRSSLDLAVRRQLLDRNVAHATHARRRRPTRPRARAWTAKELADFLDAARSQRLYPALHLAAFSGMRRGEVVGLKWSDLDRESRRLSIARTLQNVAGNPVKFDVKTRTSRRCVDLDGTTMDVLKQWRRRLYRNALPHGTDDWMFLNTSGRFLNPESVTQLFDPDRQANTDGAAHPISRLAPHACVTSDHGGRTHQGRQRAPRPRSPRLHDAHLSAPASWHERGRRRSARGSDPSRQRVDVYRLDLEETPGQRLVAERAGRRRR